MTKHTELRGVVFLATACDHAGLLVCETPLPPHMLNAPHRTLIRSIRTDADGSLATYDAEEEKTDEELYTPSPEITTRTPTTTTRAPTDLDAAFAQIRKDLIGRLDPITTPFGPKPLVCELVRDWCIQERRAVINYHMIDLWGRFDSRALIS